MTLIDLHCHMLPKVDDGSKDIVTALNLAKVAVEQGISHLLVTPHHMDGKYTNHKLDILQRAASLQEEINRIKLPLTVYPSQEVHLTGELLQAIEKDDILFMDETNRYLLLELPHDDIPKYSSQIIFELVAQGITPVIAHPERNQAIQKDPEKLYELVEMGCLTQLTSSSYLGIFGEKVQKLTEQIIQANLGFVFSSDAHNFKGRKFMIREAFEKLATEAGSAVVEQFQSNAKSIINGDLVEVTNLQHISSLPKPKKKFWLFKK